MLKRTGTKDSGECVLLIGDEAGEAARILEGSWIAEPRK
jgi:hypothetical protein